MRMVLARVVSAQCRCLLTRARAGSMGLARRDTLQGLSSPFSALAAVNAHENRSAVAPPLERPPLTPQAFDLYL
jgi:hypothetical protein